ncbi:MAG: hypothetical protein ACRC0Y_03790 [Fusobacteriaceae bacterium]
MKKMIYLLAALSIVGTTVLAKEVVAEPVASKEIVPTPMEAVVVKEVVEPWKFAGRAYFETEDFDNDSPLIEGDHEDGTFWGTGISATKGKLTLDLNVERRFGGDTSFINTDAEWEATRVDWKVRYQLFANQAFHLKYRTEDRVRDYSKDTYHGDWKRKRAELGTDFNHFDGLLGGWLVAGIDKDTASNMIDGKGITNEEDGWYWEGDFGPSFKLTEKLSLKPTFYTTGEMYDSYEMIENQIRIMMPYQATEKLTIMPRVRVTLGRDFDSVDSHGKNERVWEYEFGSRIRYELMANYVINDQFSTFVGVAYEQADRKFAATGEKKDIDLFWSYISLNYKFN